MYMLIAIRFGELPKLSEMQVLEERSLSGLCGNPTCGSILEEQKNLDSLTRQQSVLQDDCLFCRHASAGKNLMTVH